MLLFNEIDYILGLIRIFVIAKAEHPKFYKCGRSTIGFSTVAFVNAPSPIAISVLGIAHNDALYPR